MSALNTPSKPKADVIYDKRMASRLARTLIDRAKEKGPGEARDEVAIFSEALGYVPEFDRLVAQAIRTYKTHSKRKFTP